MKHLIKYSGIIVIFLCACSGKENKQDQAVNNMPQVTNNGKTIVFPSDSSVVFFETESIGNSVLNNQIMAPAKVSAPPTPPAL